MKIHIFIVYLILMPSRIFAGPWQILEPGMELGIFSASKPSSIGDSRITILRIDPGRWDLNVYGISNVNEIMGKTAKQWSQDNHLSVVINAGMFEEDYKTHLGYLQFQGHINNQAVNKYRSVAVFNPRDNRLPRFRIFDLDNVGINMNMILKNYDTVVQNLRLIKRPRQNRWRQSKKMWSEAALGEDKFGKILFIFSRSPFTMHDLNVELINMNINLVSAQHLEGGPEAQLYIRIGKVELELLGSYETSFNENNKNTHPWAIPNILGVRPRKVEVNNITTKP